MKEKKIEFKTNKLFLYVISNLFHLFFIFYVRLNNFKVHKILTKYNYISFLSYFLW